MFLSLHGDPHDAFPHFLGYENEKGLDDGYGFNFNFPMPPNTNYSKLGVLHLMRLPRELQTLEPMP